MSILDDGSLAAELTDALTAFEIPSAVTITRMVASGPDYDPVLTPTDYAAQGWRDAYSAAERVGTSILETDVKLFILATAPIEPRAADDITVNGKVYTVVRAELDAANACWTCQCRN